MNLRRLAFYQRSLVRRMLNKWNIYLDTVSEDEHVIVDYKELLSLLKSREKDLFNEIIRIGPEQLDIKTPFYSFEKPTKLVKIESFTFKSGRKSGVQYFPDFAYSDFMKMNSALEKDLGRGIIIDSGYRSPGRQAYLFIKYLVEENSYSLKKNASWIAMPGYSEHGNPKNPAADFSTIDGINGFSNGQTALDFELTEEFNWLQENSSKFNFHLSYPRGNKYGIAYEPWHWHWG